MLFESKTNNSKLLDQGIRLVESIADRIDGTNVSPNTGDLVLNSLENIFIFTANTKETILSNNPNSPAELELQNRNKSDPITETIMNSVTKVSIAGTFHSVCGEIYKCAGSLFESSTTKPCNTNYTSLFANEIINSTTSFQFNPSEFNSTHFTSIYSIVNPHPLAPNTTRISPVVRIEALGSDGLANTIKSNRSVIQFSIPITSKSSTINEPRQAKKQICQFFNTTLRKWSSEGCELRKLESNYFCSCNHLTDFAILEVDHQDSQSIQNENENSLSDQKGQDDSQMFTIIFPAVGGFFVLLILGLFLKSNRLLKRRITRVQSQISENASQTTEIVANVELQDIFHIHSIQVHPTNNEASPTLNEKSEIQSCVGMDTVEKTSVLDPSRLEDVIVEDIG
eukprot:TRINITY_DN5712_c0_g1_i4.p1 TRINITY_DN5712_c0_g1~~TRINITY_DN5712_c0_g1_i4.p1  ORF type:complete len:397 (+),score=88.81 TRINITY_DN5712_c0_g1_i4:1699-2889(+)